jgi:hypothetical protein
VAGATAEPLLLRENDRDELVGLTRSSSVGAGLAGRAGDPPPEVTTWTPIGSEAHED